MNASHPHQSLQQPFAHNPRASRVVVASVVRWLVAGTMTAALTMHFIQRCSKAYTASDG